MNVFLALSDGINSIIADPMIFVWITIGVFGGLVFGAIPGLTATLGITLMLPFTYVMGPALGVSTLVAIYVGGISGGLVSAILLNIPGTPSSIVTCFDGAPMAKQGRPSEALTLGVFASMVGGIFSGLALITISPVLAKVALIFGPWEYFAMGVMGLSIVVSLCSKDMIKGLISAIFGVLLAMLGTDPVSGVQRFTFDMWQLSGGLKSVAVLMGLFAYAEILKQIQDLHVKAERYTVKKIRLFPERKLIKETFRTLITSSFIGTIIGILPGIGQSTACLMSYNVARQTSKTPEKFGTGHPEGIVASEAANNAVCGGALIPMMTMAIPGDLTTAVILGGFVIHGIQPGPGLFDNNASLVNVIYVAYVLACIVMFVMFVLLMKFFIRVLSIPSNYMYPVLVVTCLLGAFTLNNRVFDCWVLLIVGVVGYIMLNSGFTLTPIVLGYILGPIIETNFRTAIITSRGNLMDVVNYPIAMSLLAVGLVMLFLPKVTSMIQARKAKATN